jgi:hypothetical protein
LLSRRLESKRISPCKIDLSRVPASSQTSQSGGK